MIETQNPTKRVMPTLLHLDSSMRHEGSRSRALSAHFAEAWQQANPSGTVVYRDLAADPIPHLDLTAFSANFVADDDRTPPQREARKLTETLASSSPRMRSSSASRSTTSGHPPPSRPGSTASSCRA